MAVGTLTSATIAGCSGDDGDGTNEDSPENTPDDTPTETPTDAPTETPTETITQTQTQTEISTETPEEQLEADFNIIEVGPTNKSVEPGDEVLLFAIIENSGEIEAEREIELWVGDERRKSWSVRLTTGEETKVEYSLDTSDLEPQRHNYEFSMGDNSMRADITVFQPAVFEFSDIEPTGETIISDEVTIQATVYNSGELSGNKAVEIAFRGDSVLTESISLEPNQRKTLDVNVDSYDRDYEEYTVRAISPDDEISGSFIATVQPVEEPDTVPYYDIENIDDVSTNGVERRDVDVTVDHEEKPIYEHSAEEIMNISKDIILDLTEASELNAVSIQFWRVGQTIGAESAFGTIDWAPNGDWANAGSVETGDYTEHEFQIGGNEYVRVIDTESPEEVEPDEEFTVAFLIKNMGLIEATLNGGIEADDETLKEFDISLDVGEQRWIEIEPTTLGSLNPVETFDLEVYGFDRLHGVTFISVYEEGFG